MSKINNRKWADFAYETIPYAMIALVILCAVAAYLVHDAYQRGFDGEAVPKSVRERILKQKVKRDSEEVVYQGKKEQPKKPSKQKNAVSPESSKEESPESVARAEWGQFGDYFSGTLNPIFGFVSVIALFLTILYQSREMKLSTEELRNSGEALKAQNYSIRQQSFEQTFFSWLGTYREILGSIEDSEQEESVLITYQGRRALRLWFRSKLRTSRVLLLVNRDIGTTAYSEINDGCGSTTDDELLIDLATGGYAVCVSDCAMRQWEELYSSYEYQLDSLFRILFRLLQWIDSQQDVHLSPAQKWLYVSIVRSQLSWIEMVYLFFNGQTRRGEKFKHLAEKYALFDNLTFESNPIILLLRKCPPDTDGYCETAYNSAKARKELGLPETAEETLVLAAKYVLP